MLPEVLYVELKRGEHGASGRMARHAHRIDVGDSVDLTHLVPLTEKELVRLGDGGRFVYDVVTVVFKEGGVRGGHYVSATRELDAAALGGGAAPAAAAAPPAASAFNFFDDGNPPVLTTLSATMDENSQNTYVVGLVARDYALHERVLGQRRQMNDAQRRDHALNVTAGVGLDAASVGGGGDGDGEDETKPYCLCGKPQYGEMVGCDNDACASGEWFHLHCVGLTAAPKGAWKCPPCRTAAAAAAAAAATKKSHHRRV